MAKLSIMLIPQEGYFVAQCLEHDIRVQAHDLSTLIEKLGQIIEAEKAIRNGSLEQIAPAPIEFLKMWSTTELSRISLGEPVIEVRLCA